MSLKSGAYVGALLSVLVLAQSGEAFGQEGEKDGARFRGGVSLEGGALIAPDLFNVGLAGVKGQIGVQINHLVGLYAVPHFDVVFGNVGGVHLAAALVVDFSIIDEVTIGAGPELATFAAIGADETSISAAGGAMYGGRLHLGFQPAWGFGENGIRRKALSIGVDARFLAGDVGAAAVSTTTAEAGVTDFVFSPMLTIGYQAF
jgi:hypothetical protein